MPADKAKEEVGVVAEAEEVAAKEIRKGEWPSTGPQEERQQGSNM